MRDTTIFELSNDLFENVSLGMYYCGKRINTLNHVYGPEIRNHYLFVLVNKGHARFLKNDGEKELKAQDLLIMCPGEKIHYIADTPWNIQWVGLYGEAIANYLELLSIDGNNPIIHIDNYSAVSEIFEELYKSISKERTQSSRCYQISLIYKFFSLLLYNKSIKTFSSIEDSAKKIIDYNFDKDISVNDIAKSLFISHAHLTRKFTEKYDISPKNYLIQKRIEAAKRLLCNNNATIMEISNSVGYYDQLYFSRIFKKNVGFSPSEYRKKFVEL